MKYVLCIALLWINQDTQAMMGLRTLTRRGYSTNVDFSGRKNLVAQALGNLWHIFGPSAIKSTLQAPEPLPLDEMNFEHAGAYGIIANPKITALLPISEWELPRHLKRMQNHLASLGKSQNPAAWPETIKSIDLYTVQSFFSSLPLDGHGQYNRHMYMTRLASDGTAYIASGSLGNGRCQIFEYNPRTRLVNTFEAPPQFNVLDIHPENRMALISSKPDLIGPHKAGILKFDSNSIFQITSPIRFIRLGSFSPSGRYIILASSSDFRHPVLINIEKETCTEISVPDTRVISISYDPYEHHALLVTEQQNVFIVNLQTAEVIHVNDQRSLHTPFGPQPLMTYFEDDGLTIREILPDQIARECAIDPFVQDLSDAQLEFIGGLSRQTKHVVRRGTRSHQAFESLPKKIQTRIQKAFTIDMQECTFTTSE